MTDAGEKLRDRALQFRFNKFAHHEWTTDRIIAFVRAELERAAGIAERGREAIMVRSSVSMPISETLALLAEIASAIRKLKE